MKINSEKIKLFYAQLGLNQKDFAEKANLSRQGLNQILAKGSCKGESLIKIANALDVEPKELIKE